MPSAKEIFNPLAIKIIIPFGRFASRLTSSGEKKLFIAREKTRALLVDRLISGEGRGAYLVTGRRGVGKTSFVEACLEEYTNSVYMRFLRADHGRGLPNVLLTVLFVLALLLAYLAASGMLELTIASANDNFLLYPVVALLFLVCISPLFLAYSILRALVLFFFRQREKVSFGAATLFMLMLAVAISSAAAELIITTELVATAEVINKHYRLILTLLSFNPNTLPLITESIALAFSSELMPLTLTLGSALLAIVIVIVLGRAQTFDIFRHKKPLSKFKNASYIAALSFLAIVAAIVTMALGSDPLANTIAEAIMQLAAHLPDSSLSAKILLHTEVTLDKISGLSNELTRPTIAFFCLWAIRSLLLYKLAKKVKISSKNPRIDYLVSALIVTCLLAVICKNSLIIILVGILISIDIFYLIQQIAKTQKNETENRFYAPPFEAILLLKALFLVIGAVQLAYPIIKLDMPLRDNIIIYTFKGDLPNSLSNLPNGYFAVNPFMEVTWLALTFLGLVIIFLAEYGWIVRPFMSERENPAMGQAKKQFDAIFSHHDERRWPEIETEPTDKSQNSNRKNAKCIENFRAVSRVTLPWLIISSWIPAIVVRINLGFEMLKHQSVIFAMLHGMRTQYLRNLFSPLATSTLLVNAVKLILLLLAINMIAHYSFGLYNLSGHYSIDKPTTSLKVAVNDLNRENTNYELNVTGATGAKKLKVDYCKLLLTPLNNSNKNSTNKAIWTKSLCAAWPDFTNSLLPILYLEIIPIRLHGGNGTSSSNQIERFVFWLFHDHYSLPTHIVDGEGKISGLVADETVSFRIYHALLLLAILAAWRWLSSALPLTPYRRTLAQIDELLEKLTGKRSEKRSRSYWAPIGYVRSIFLEDKSSAVEQEAQDPRSVELGFMELLEDIRRSDIRLPFGINASVSFATPEITFVFDELDKITGASSSGELNATVIEQEISAMQAEVNRAYAMQNLLSDMKRLITAAPAKFIFVGNRLLHDEWTADQSRRQPLLSSIFDAEFYIPSLITDNSTANVTPSSPLHLSDRIVEFMVKRLWLAQEVHERFQKDRSISFVRLSKENNSTSYSIDKPMGNSKGVRRVIYDEYKTYRLFREKLTATTSELDYCERIESIEGSWHNSFLIGFMRYLTYRSVGEPKNLELLIAKRVQQLDRFIFMAHRDIDGIKRENKCRDVLYFNHTSLFHIQLINYIYQHLTERFGSRLAGRDDKIVVSLFYIFDFLLKFHNRAFSWANLERIDELAHIHRIPELQETLRELVEGSSERLLHPILNGMYNFRFRSEFAQEIGYLSKVSLAEMAALNFTIDEAKSMKATYISELKDSDDEDFDKVNALGELYEFDQQHEHAREQYRKAIKMLDKIMYQRLGQTVSTPRDSSYTINPNIYKPGLGKNSAAMLINIQAQPGTQNIIRALLSWDKEELESLLWAVPWGVRRIRLMLQIGMSFELAQDYERAKAHYIDARSLASTFFHLYLVLIKDKGHRQLGSAKGWRFTVLKDILRHIHLLYQPFLAEAWLGEKMVEVINSSAVLLESELIRLRRTLPFVSQRDATFDRELGLFVDTNSKLGEHNSQSFALKNFGGGSGSSFSVLLAELHNKTGDLYFYKGSQFKCSFPNREINLNQAGEENKETEFTGYLLRAHFHYAFALHELRRHNFYTRKISRFKYTLPRIDSNHKSHDSIPPGQWALVIYQSLFNTLKDFADVTLVRGSTFNCWNNLPHNAEDTLLTDKTSNSRYRSIQELIHNYGLYNAIVAWLETSDYEIIKKIKMYLVEYSEQHPEAKVIKNTKIDWSAVNSSQFTSTENLTQILLPLALGIWQSDKNEPNLYLSKSEINPDNYLRSLEFGKGSKPWQRLVFSLLCARTAADFIAEAGNASEASYELLLFMERIHITIHRFRIIDWLNTTHEAKLDSANVNLSALLVDGKVKLLPFTDEHANFICFVAELAEECVDEYETQAWLSWRRRPVAQADSSPDNEESFYPYQLGDAIAPIAATTLTAILLDLEYFVNRVTNYELKEKLKLTKNSLDSKLKFWLGKDWDECANSTNAGHDLGYRELLVYILKRHQYPILNQLHALKVLCNEIALAANSSELRTEDGQELLAYLDDLHTLDENYAAPMHFTPYASAESAALATLSGILSSEPYEASRVHRRALEKLQQARSAYTMGKQYYANIRRMYYLYDDFNDRRMHANHALLMSSMEVASILEALLNEPKLLKSAVYGGAVNPPG